MALTYLIRRGARTRVEFREGLGAPDTLRREIASAWSSGDFETSIEEEALERVRTHFAREGLFTPRLSADVETSRDGKTRTLVIGGEPGPRARTRRVAFSGGARLPAGKLEALVKGRVLEDQAWGDPRRLENAVVALYREEGYLAAAAHARPPVVEGDEAVLAVDDRRRPPLPPRHASTSGAARGSTARRPSRPSAWPRRPPTARPRSPRLGRASSPSTASVASTRCRCGWPARCGRRRPRSDVRGAGRGRLAAGDSRGRGRGCRPRDAPSLGSRGHPPPGPARGVAGLGRHPQAALRHRPRARGDPRARGPPEGRRSPWRRARRAAVEPVRAQVDYDMWPALRLRYGLQLVTEKPLNESGDNAVDLGATAELTRAIFLGRAVSTALSGEVRPDIWNARGVLSAPRTFGRPLRTEPLPRSRARADRGRRGPLAITIPAVGDSWEATLEERWRRGKLETALSYDIQWLTLGFPETDFTDVRVPPRSPRRDRAARRAQQHPRPSEGLLLLPERRLRGEGAGVGVRLLADLHPAVRLCTRTRQPGRGLGCPLRAGLWRRTELPHHRASQLRRAHHRSRIRPRSRGPPGPVLGGRSHHRRARLEPGAALPHLGRPAGRGLHRLRPDRRRSSQDARGTDRRLGTGLGLRYSTPVGVLRVDLGFPLLGPDKKGKLYFGLGQAF